MCAGPISSTALICLLHLSKALALCLILHALVAPAASIDGECIDECSPSGKHKSIAVCTRSYCDKYKKGGAYASRCLRPKLSPDVQGYRYALLECKATCGLCGAKPLDKDEHCEPHLGLSGGTPADPAKNVAWPQYIGLKLGNGSDANPEWYKPYMEHRLDAQYQNIEWPKGQKTESKIRVDCNPASCDNPPECGIPVCRGVGFCASSLLVCSGQCHNLNKGLLSTCGGTGCGSLGLSTIQNAAPHLPGGPPSNTSWVLSVPGSREGMYWGFGYQSGYQKTFPAAGLDSDREHSGYLTPSEKYCNPLKWIASSKWSITHTGMSPQIDQLERSAALLFVKTTVCLKANCSGKSGKQCKPQKCYANTSARCLKLHGKVFPRYQQYIKNKHIRRAWRLYRAGNYAPCTQLAEKAAAQFLAGV